MERVEYAVERVTRGGETWWQPYTSAQAAEREKRDGIVVRRIVRIGAWIPVQACVVDQTHIR